MKTDAMTKPSRLPNTSGSREGASGGSLGGATAKDLERGYIPCDEQDSGYDGLMDADDAGPKPGFLGRPHGWER